MHLTILCQMGIAAWSTAFLASLIFLPVSALATSNGEVAFTLAQTETESEGELPPGPCQDAGYRRTGGESEEIESPGDTPDETESVKSSPPDTTPYSRPIVPEDYAPRRRESVPLTAPCEPAGE